MQPAKTDTAKVASTNWTQWVADWPADQRNAIQDIQLKYGPPDLVSPKLVLWMNKGDFREIVVSKDSVDHNFPMPHKDFVLVTINQKIPLDKVQDLASFSGSLICDRTGGTLAVRCNSLGMDIAALNAAREIIDGKRTADDARQSLAQIAQAYQKGEKPDATQKLSFDVAKGNTGDPGEAQTGTASERP